MTDEFADSGGERGQPHDDGQGEASGLQRLAATLEEVQGVLPPDLAEKLFFELGAFVDSVSGIFSELAHRRPATPRPADDGASFLWSAFQRLDVSYGALWHFVEVGRVRQEANAALVHQDHGQAPGSDGATPAYKPVREGEVDLPFLLDGLVQAGCLDNDTAEVVLDGVARLIRHDFPADQYTQIRGLEAGSPTRARFTHALASARERTGLLILRQVIAEHEVEQLRALQQQRLDRGAGVAGPSVN